MNKEQLSEVEAALTAYRGHAPIGFACCSAHPAADAAAALLDEIRELRKREAESITYRVQPHDITTLTAPMWEACGIECPVMIGADCPGSFDGRDPSRELTTCPGRSSKFPNAAAEVVWGWSLTAQPETCGDVDQPIGFNAIFRADPDDEDGGPMGAGVILTTDDRGSVSLVRYETPEELWGVWSKLQDEEAKYDRANCEECTPDTPCYNHADEEN